MEEAAWFETLLAGGERMIAATGLPRSVVLFVLIVLGGFLFAMLARLGTRKLVLRGGQLISRLGRTPVPSDIERLSKTIGTAVYWLIVLLALMSATEMLGLPVVTHWLSGVASYVPRIIAAIFIVVLGTFVARIAQRVVTSAARTANLPAAERIGKVTEVALLVCVGLVSVEQLGIEISLLTTVILIVLAGLLGGTALAFGLGGRDWVANVLSAHYVERLYQVGQIIRVRDIEGRIVRITETAVILESDDGEVAVPAREFSTAPSTLVLRGGKAKGLG